MCATKGEDNYFLPFNMHGGIKKYNKTEKPTLPDCFVFNHYFYVFTNKTKIHGNFFRISPLL